ncbi:MAG: UDP-3-O-(3-hydroxymyristoyl)glucosamine N-acyltransferase [Prevotellaceae bacterium]|jgi:UDP-3-O-[3-hydroxymyristoyl] glucosamine N-acyltransferase|nr:UDP-3-O-(3-hydroxymyristoyl)glucosamine N-acyltransferase [Prevotellaceae bacterium]
MEFTAQQIADYLNGEVIGNKDITVNDFSKIEHGASGTLTFLSNPKYMPHIYTTKADVVLVDTDFVPEREVSATLIKVKSAYSAIGKLFGLIESFKPQKNGISEKAYVAKSAKLGKNVYVGAFTTIGENAVIGNNVKIHPNTNIDDNVEIKDDSVIYTNVSICYGCVVGSRNIIHSGAVIGADGFGFAPDEQGFYNKIPQIGNVVLGDDVEVGANSTIDRATIGSTVIGDGVKIDNLVQIAHNVEIGNHTAIAAQAGIAGSTKVGKHCVLAGQVGIAGHLNIADRTVLGAQAGVASHIKAEGQIFQGSPNIPVGNFRRSSVVFKQLPDLLTKIYQMEKRIKALEAKKMKYKDILSN